MAVDELGRLPSPGVFGQAIDRDLSRADQKQRLLAIDLVAVDVDRTEVEIGPQGLQLPEVDRHRVGIPEPRLLDGGPVGLKIVRGQLAGSGDVASLHLVEAEAVPGEGEMVLDEGIFALELLRLDDEELVDVRVEPRDRQADQEQPRSEPGSG